MKQLVITMQDSKERAQVLLLCMSYCFLFVFVCIQCTWCFILFFVLCLVCPMLQVSLYCPFRFSLTLRIQQLIHKTTYRQMHDDTADVPLAVMNSPVFSSFMTCGAGTAFLSVTPEFIPCFWWGLCCQIFSFLCSVLQIVVCSFVLWFWPLCCLSFFEFTDSDYPFDIFKLFLKLS